MPDDLGGKAVALEMLGNGLAESIRSTSHYHLDQHQSSGDAAQKIAEFRKKCRFRIWREQSSHAHQIFLKFSMDAYRSGCRKNNSRQARY
ncbi:hypothetical protein [Rhizobium laguerreae]|uniref:hypothetical protein n=1 Tax=Rhizobium laguerreae TaxID=1076926 RepID=UPI001C906682|nr:hypothetical protein [Rhizobium laguerreae]MBY3115144.1 hypothetical protein [Rhizobium laguerreae]